MEAAAEGPSKAKDEIKEEEEEAARVGRRAEDARVARSGIVNDEADDDSSRQQRAKRMHGRGRNRERPPTATDARRGSIELVRPQI
jgi:hypothetical protein